ncbi:MAG: outer membrane beta-barrel protein, partial [Chitinophagaceae bacterium]
MKFYVILAAASVIMTGRLNAQHVNLGIKAGLNVYTINNNNDADYKSKAGFNAGLIGHIHLDKQLALQPEIVYSGQGAKYNTGNVETK